MEIHRILVVEDNPALLAALDAMLQEEGYEVSLAESFQAAHRWLDSHQPDLMILDLSLPDGSGGELVEMLNERGTTPPFLVLTGQGSELDAVRMMKLGARDYLVKQGNFLSLLPTVIQQLDQQLLHEKALRKAEANLVQNEMFHRCVTEHCVAGIIKIDISGKIRYVNPAACSLFRFSAGYFLNRSLSDLHHMAIRESEDPYLVNEFPLQLALQGLPTPSQHVIGWRRNNDSLIWTICSITPLFKLEDFFEGIVVTLIDVTDKRQYERKARRDVLQMQGEIRVQTFHLEIANQRLEEEIHRRRTTEEALLNDQKLLRKLLYLYERDRKLIGYEIHDGLVQQVTAALMILQSSPIFEENSTDEDLVKVNRFLKEAIEEARRIILGVRPPLLKEAGLVGALSSLFEVVRTQFELDVDFEHQLKEERFFPFFELTIFRIIQEAINNVVRHSQSEHVSVKLIQHQDHLEMEIRDEGIGFQPAQLQQGGFGVQGIQERTEFLGGSCMIESEPDNGTVLAFEIPLQSATLDQLRQESKAEIDT
ncbi:Hypothetical protein PBC10988_36420 [Planctomycetales bacterium 10988]|nr:Hypothetical protein PBC10988_36420 [Planctomycetales bacterium 10988]